MRIKIRSPHEKNLVLSILLIALLAGYMTMIGKRDEGFGVRAFIENRTDAVSAIAATEKSTSNMEARISALDTNIAQNEKIHVALTVNEKITFIPVHTGIEKAPHIEIVKDLDEGDEILVSESKGLRNVANVKILARNSAH